MRYTADRQHPSTFLTREGRYLRYAKTLKPMRFFRVLYSTSGAVTLPPGTIVTVSEYGVVATTSEPYLSRTNPVNRGWITWLSPLELLARQLDA